MPQAAGSRALFDLLEDARRRLRRTAIFEGIALIVLGIALVISLGTLAARLGMPSVYLALAELLVVGAISIFAVARYWAVLGRATRDPESVARWLDRAVAHQLDRTDIAFRSAVELERDRGRYGESEALADHAVAETTRLSKTIDTARVVSDEAWPSLKNKMVALTGALVTVAALGLMMPGSLRTALGAMSTVSDLEEALSPPRPEPRLGDIRLTYRFPAYANRPARTFVSNTGDIRALPGTEVVIETRARRAMTEATLIVSHGAGTDEDASRIAVEVDGRELRATVVVTRGGRYRFRTRAIDGEDLEERRGHSIELELDTPPDVKMVKPTESPLEVNESDRLEVAFEAEDDFGLGDISVAWRILGTAREGHQKISATARGERRAKGDGQFDLTKLNLRPGDRVSYSIEARDNDTVNGPKIGASVTQELRVYSKEAHHRDVMALQEKALDMLVHVLGDNLEGPVEYDAEPKTFAAALETGDRILTRANETNDVLKEVVAAVRDDPLGRPEIGTAFETARRDLHSTARNKTRALNECKRSFKQNNRPSEPQARRVTSAQQSMIGGLEKNVVYLADLLNDQRLLDAEALAKELRDQQDNLRKALEDYKNAPTDAKRQALREAINDIKKRIGEILQQMAQMKGSIPQDFANKDALDTKDAREGMDKVEKKIEEGDLEGAMAELEKMLESTEEMLSQMQAGRQELGNREYDEVTKMAKELQQTLSKVEEEQRELARKTDLHAQKMLDKMKERLGDADKFVKKQRERLEAARKHLETAEEGARLHEGDAYEQTIRRLDDSLRALEAQDFGATKEMLEHTLRLQAQLQSETRRRAEQTRLLGALAGERAITESAAKDVEEARPPIEKVLEDIEQLMPDPKKLMSEHEQKQMQKLAEDQKRLQGETKKLEQQLDKLGQELPIVGQGMPQMLQEAGQAMGESSQGLKQGDAPGSGGAQQRALDSLNQFREALQQMGGQKGGGSGGVPLPFAPPSGSGDPDGSPGGRDPRGEKVEIPKPEQYRAPAEFREEILEAAKQGTAEQYREAVRKYYEEIVK